MTNATPYEAHMKQISRYLSCIHPIANRVSLCDRVPVELLIHRLALSRRCQSVDDHLKRILNASYVIHSSQEVTSDPFVTISIGHACLARTR